GPGTLGVATIEQGRREEGTPVGVPSHGPRLPHPSADELGLAREARELLEHLATLSERGDRAHAHAFETRVADHDLRQRIAQRLEDIAHPRRRHERLADRRALLSGLDGHLAYDLAHEQLELGSPRPRIGAEDRGVERIGLGGEAYGVGSDHRMLTQLEG